MTNRTLVLLYLLIFTLSSCGRPKNYKEQAILSFQGAHAALANNNYANGVLIFGKWDKYPNMVYRFWVKPGVDEVKTVNIYVPTGKVTFYGMAADSDWNFKCDITNKKKLKPAKKTGFTINFSSGNGNCNSTNDLLYNKNTVKKNQFEECIKKGTLNCGKYTF